MNGGCVGEASTVLNDGNWHHVAAVLEDDGTPDVSEVRLYVDGQEEVLNRRDSVPINTVADNGVHIGAQEYDPGIMGYFSGTLDDVRIYNRALSVEEIADITGPVLNTSSDTFIIIAFEGGTDPNDQSLTISNPGGGTLNWTIVDVNDVIFNPPDWLTITPTSGSLGFNDSNDITLSVDVNGLSIGQYSYSFGVADSNAIDSPQNILVQLYIVGPGNIIVPIDYRTIQAAINAAVNGDTISVFSGTYAGTGNRSIDFQGKSITVQSISGPEVTIIDCEDSERGFYFHSGEGSRSVLSGFTIKRGLVTQLNQQGVSGAGIFISNASPVIRNCIIEENTIWGFATIGPVNPDPGESATGGGIAILNGSPCIQKCIIQDNIVYGGITSVEDATPGVPNPQWGHKAYGGGVYCNVSSAVFEDCVIRDNTVIGGDGCITTEDGQNAYGGGIYTQSSNVRLENCRIFNNTATGGNGHNEDTFYDPPVGPGNGGSAYGGGMSGESLTCVNCLIFQNTCMGGDAGTSSMYPYVTEGGDAMGAGSWSTSPSTFSNCTFTNNTLIAGVGANGGVNGTFLGGGAYGSAELNDCILWDNGGDDLAGGANAVFSCTEETASGTGNIQGDPNFVTGPMGDYYLSQIAAGQAIDSSCVDAGSVLAEDTGIWKYTTRADEVGDMSTVDMGYHYPMTYPIGDIDLDTKVNFSDYSILANQWMDVPGNPSADLAPYPDGDNFVDMDDLLIFVSNWLEGMP